MRCSTLFLWGCRQKVFCQLSSGLLRAPLRFGRQKTGRLNPAYPAAFGQPNLYSALPVQSVFRIAVRFIAVEMLCFVDKIIKLFLKIGISVSIKHIGSGK